MATRKKKPSGAQNSEDRPKRVLLLSTELPPTVSESMPRVTGPEAAAQLIASFIGRKDREHFVVVHLSTQHDPVAIETVSVGCLSSALVHPREVFKSAVLANSACIVIGHNHPSGDLTPSSEDRAVYRQLREAGTLMGIEVLDFLIVSGTRWKSLMGEA